MPPSETTTEEKSSRSYWGFVLWPLAVIVLYVLSAGPALFLCDKNMLNYSFYAAVYGRLDSVVERTFLKRPFGMYLHLWSPELYRKDGSNVFE